MTTKNGFLRFWPNFYFTYIPETMLVRFYSSFYSQRPYPGAKRRYPRYTSDRWNMPHSRWGETGNFFKLYCTSVLSFDYHGVVSFRCLQYSLCFSWLEFQWYVEKSLNLTFKKHLIFTVFSNFSKSFLLIVKWFSELTFSYHYYFRRVNVNLNLSPTIGSQVFS